MSDFNNGFIIGTQNALALLRSHLGKVEGFDGEAFDRDVKQLFSNMANSITIDEGANGIRCVGDALLNKADIQSVLDLQRHHQPD